MSEGARRGRTLSLGHAAVVAGVLLCALAITHCYRLGVEELRRDISQGDADVDADGDADADGDDSPDGDEEPECVDPSDCEDDDPCTVETCTDAGTCLQELAPSGTPCGSDLDTECTDPDTCDGAGACLPRDEPEGAPCGVQNVPCHINDHCDGDGRCVDNGFAAAGVQCANDTFCDGFEVCDGAGTCEDGSPPCPSLTCQEPERQCVGCTSDDECPRCYWCDAGVCEPQAEGEDRKDDCPLVSCFTGDCDGSGWCAYEPDRTNCGSREATECSNPDSCDGEGTCLPNHEAVDTPCGDGGTVCHPQDLCDGAGSCRDMGFATVGTPCGDAVDVQCSDPDSCDGAGTCLANDWADQTVCVDSDPCTMDEVCKEGTCVGELLDGDGDGFAPTLCGGDDCDDTSHRARPGGTEALLSEGTCTDGLDNDCDGATDLYDPQCGMLCPGLCDTHADCVDCGGAEWCHPRGCCALCLEETCPCALPI